MPGSVVRLPLSTAAQGPAEAVEGPPPDRPPARIRKLVRGEHRLGLGSALSWGWLLGPFVVLVYWTWGSAVGFIDSHTLPAPWTTVSSAADLVQNGKLQQNVLISASRAGQGLVMGLLAGVALALLSGLSLAGGYLIDGLVQLKRAVPSLALMPFFILWFGIGEPMKVLLIAVGVFIPIYVHTHTALRAIDLRFVELSETLALTRFEFIRDVILPGSLPGFMLGLRFAVMAAWLGLVVVEQFNTVSGIGYMINQARSYAQTEVMFVGIVLYALLGIVSDRLVVALEARTLSWRRTLAK
jgi:sulfonate transport system permease protein